MARAPSRAGLVYNGTTATYAQVRTTHNKKMHSGRPSIVTTSPRRTHRSTPSRASTSRCSGCRRTGSCRPLGARARARARGPFRSRRTRWTRRRRWCSSGSPGARRHRAPGRRTRGAEPAPRSWPPSTRRTSDTLSARNGGSPASIWYAITPNERTSDAGPTSPPVAGSGDRYATVPTTAAVLVSPAPASRLRTSPKSASFTTPLSATRTFADWRSQRTMPCARGPDVVRHAGILPRGPQATGAILRFTG
jgi:hypothetical protein